MITSILIIAVSLALFVYWFRYSCALILSTRTTADYSARVAADNRMSFIQVRDRIAVMPAIEMDAVCRSLARDYRMVSMLLRRSADNQAAGNPIEDTLVRADFRVMQMTYAFVRHVSQTKARSVLAEMTQVVGHLANEFGERAAQSASA